MKYRNLKVGEIVRAGDEITSASNPRGMGYITITELGLSKVAGTRVKANDICRFRRRVKGGRE